MKQTAWWGLAWALGASVVAAAPSEVEEVTVWAEVQNPRAAGYTNPTSLLFKEDMIAINATTTEDLVKFEPSLVIRKRYIGDGNGTLGMRGANMFATARSMVFADGVPLHYFLQTRWNGAPRWAMVSASEIAQVEILYGPFSAEYSGNAMGGVVLIETAIPAAREVRIDLDAFSQNFAAYGFSERLNGYKTFISYGDTFGDTSVYLAYNRLANDSQPQSYYFDQDKDHAEPSTQAQFASAQQASGFIRGQDVFGSPAYYFGDTGVEGAVTNNVKLKLGHEWGPWAALLNLAFEDRNTLRDAPNTYVLSATGEPVWAGDVVQEGLWLSVPTNRLGATDLTRESLSLGVRLRGDVTETSRIEVNLSDFRILQDVTYNSSRNLADPAFDGSGLTTAYDDTGWRTVDAKWVNQGWGPVGSEWRLGLRHEAYRLNLDQFRSRAWRAGDNAGFTGRSGGESRLDAAFGQWHWQLNAQWAAALGLRYERWASHGGYFTARSSPEVLVAVDDNDQEQFSPKFSLGWQPHATWLIRYSVAKAYRFPLVEELFSQSASYASVQVPRPDLQPENGLHHNVMVEKTLDTGYLRLNLFSETIHNAIESQTNNLPGGQSVTAFSAVDEVQTSGLELILNAYDVAVAGFNVRANATYTHSEITDNSTAEGAAISTIVGKDYPRMPRWRGNVLATYAVTSAWAVSGSWQYADKSYGRFDNRDTAEQVMGAQDGYSRVGIKTTYAFSDQWQWRLGVDNLTDELSYVAHPWPRRTVYVGLSYAL